MFEEVSVQGQGKDEGFTCPVLIPGLDLMNHNPAAKVTWSWGHSECGFSNNEAIRGGSQIWNNYGPKSNEERANNPIIVVHYSLLTNFFCSNHGLRIQSVSQLGRRMHLSAF